MATQNIEKPIPLRIIFILNALMILLPFVFYYLFSTNKLFIEGVIPIYMAYTGIAYIVSFVLLVVFILKKNLIGLRTVIVVNFLIAIPASAYIGMMISLVSMFISFHKKVKLFFTS